MKQVNTPGDVPAGPHYAVIEFRYVRESSGWGPENDSDILAPRYYVTTDRGEWVQHIERLEARPSPYTSAVSYVALHVNGKASINRAVQVNVT